MARLSSGAIRDKAAALRTNSTLSDYAQARHTRREAGIQCHGWQAQIHPWSLDSGTNLSGIDLH